MKYFTVIMLAPIVLVLLPILYYLVPYLQNSTLRDIPGPVFAKFSNLWLLLQARLGHRYKSVDDLHKKYGKLVRIQPNHISIADSDAINIVYGHGNGFLKR